ncbi:type II and III secretion system protein family protein [Sulfitobacter sp. NFXS29]|uniref:type II and III secretion system protein family protein n=1 Tax=Sulfitobacter sp. NFXS29 TaxID=2818438 RepID=UPI0032E024F6|tara:strand:+ start:4919 stop:6256 length:1338 start_codon:yes stop_codon:yes gene_type:complete
MLLKLFQAFAFIAAGSTLFLPEYGYSQVVIEATGRPVRLYPGEGKLIRLDQPSSTVFLANPAVADIEVKSANLVYLYGKAAGKTTLFALDELDNVTLSSVVNVALNVDALNRAAKSAVPHGSFQIRETEGAMVMSGRVPSLGDAQQIETVLRALSGQDVPIINSLKLDNPAQVNLQVKIAEVSRTVTEDLGTNWTALGNGLNGGRGAPGGFALNTDFTVGSQLQGVSLEALQQEGLVTILSEPNLTARSGDKASFLAGGRFPYQTAASDDRVEVVFEPYGVELEFQPEVLQSNKIKLEVDTKVRELDFSNGSTSNTQGLPLILERSAATTIEVGSGQSFAIAGLFKATSQQTIDEVPGLGQVPLLGALFRSTSYQSGESELVIIVTPYLVEPGNPKKFRTPVDGFRPAGALRRNLTGELSVGVPVEDGQAVSVKSINGKAGLLLQ